MKEQQKGIRAKKASSHLIDTNLLPEERFKLILSNYQHTNKIVLHHKRSLLIHGDVLDEDSFDSHLFDLIITSPPYNVDIQYNSHKDDLSYEEYLAFSETWMRNCFKWTKNKEGCVSTYL